MKVSVVVPVYNVEAYLPRCLDSLLAQVPTFDDFEIICVDDASTDDSLAVLKEYARQHPAYVSVLQNQLNRGLGAARDAGVRAARGEYLMFVDSDDYVEPNYLRTYVEAIEAHPCDILIGGYQLCAPDRAPERATTRLFPHSDWTLVLFSAAWAKLFRREFLQRNNIVFSGIRYAEDTYLALCAFAAGARCRFIDYAGYCYWQSPDSLTRGAKAACGHHERDLAELYAAFARRPDAAAMPEDRANMVEYFYLADMLNTLLVFDRGCGWDRMCQKMTFFLEDLHRKFPDYRHNPYLGFTKPKGIHTRARLAVTGFVLLDRLGLRSLPFRIAALVGRAPGASAHLPEEDAPCETMDGWSGA